MTSNNALTKSDTEIETMQASPLPTSVKELLDITAKLDTAATAELLATVDPQLAASALRSISSQDAGAILELISDAQKTLILSSLPNEIRQQWAFNSTFPEDSIGRMMEYPWAVFPPSMTVAESVEILRSLVKREFITYGYVIDAQQKLIGVIVMRDLLFAEPQSTLQEIMLTNPFSLHADTPLMDAMREVLNMHFPVYPVTDKDEKLVGAVRGHSLFEAQAIEISAQAGSMVGVEKEEKLSTPWTRSFRSRHPWLQLNLLTAFVAGAVVSIFQNTIDQLVILAAFLPVLAGQSGNTGCQALAVTIRGITMREIQNGSTRKLLIKEGLLGLLNGIFVGITAAIGMYVLASSQSNPQALALAFIVLAAMIGSCFVSGLFGAIVPLALRKLGADPATASSIFLTTATDVASMGLLLSLASYFLL